MAELKKGEINIRGKIYRTVALRVNEFRTLEKYENYGCETDLVSIDNVKVVVKAVITNAENRIVATGYGEEFRSAGNINKTSALENCETSAIGRALACLGLGGEEYASANEVQAAIEGQKPATPVQVAAINALIEDNTITGGQLLASFGHTDPSRLFVVEADRVLNAVATAQKEQEK